MKRFDLNEAMREDKERPVLIVGAGITGCVAGHRLARQGHRVVIVEKEKQVGGLSRTFRYGGFGFDIGPHRFFTTKPEVLACIRETLRDRYRILPRKSSIYFLGRHYSWPLRPASLLHLPAHLRLRSLRDLLRIFSRSRPPDKDDFENYILSHYGPTLYNSFFKEYTAKFLKHAPPEIHVDWAKSSIQRAVIDGRIAHESLFDILKLVLRLRAAKTEFMYPDDGIDVFCRTLADEIVNLYGGRVLTGAQVTAVRHDAGLIKEVAFDGLKVAPRAVVWTGKINDACRLLGVPDPGLYYLSLVLYNFEIERPLRSATQWTYYGSKEIFSRVSIPKLFSERLAPAGKHGLCVEVTCREHDRCWNNPGVLIGKVIHDLAKVGLLKGPAEIGDMHVEKVADAYPVYILDYRKRLETVIQEMGSFRNFVLAGRSGLFWYNNMDDSIENGIAVAEKIAQDTREEMSFVC